MYCSNISRCGDIASDKTLEDKYLADILKHDEVLDFETTQAIQKDWVQVATSKTDFEVVGVYLCPKGVFSTFGDGSQHLLNGLPSLSTSTIESVYTSVTTF